MRTVSALPVSVAFYGLFVFYFSLQGFAAEQTIELAKQTSVKERVHQGNLLFVKGELQEAFSQYQEALKEAAEAAKAKIHYNLANTLNRLGRFEEAKKEYQEALRLNPTYEDSKYNLEATHLAKQGIATTLRPQAEMEGASEQLDAEILRLLQVLEQREFGFPKGTPQPPTPPQPQSKQAGKDW